MQLSGGPQPPLLCGGSTKPAEQSTTILICSSEYFYCQQPMTWAHFKTLFSIDAFPFIKYAYKFSFQWEIIFVKSSTKAQQYERMCINQCSNLESLPVPCPLSNRQAPHIEQILESNKSFYYCLYTSSRNEFQVVKK